MNLAEKLVEIRKNIDGFKKDTKGFQYKYVSGTQVLAKIIDKMNELKVLLIPGIVGNTRDSQIHEYTTVDNKGKEKHNVDYLVSADMVMTWLDAENPEDKLEVPFALFGQQNEISKAFGSGLTYSERYFLLKFFGQPTDDDDPDSRQGKKDYKNTKTISDAQLKRLWAIAKTHGIEVKTVTDRIAKEFKKTPQQLTRTEYDNVVSRIEKVEKK